LRVKQYLLYLLRWQCSTPILAVVIWLLPLDSISEAVVANLIGGLMFYWIDRRIFGQVNLYVWWERKSGTCVDCGKEATVMRVIKAGRYDKENDPAPQYRCRECANSKLREVLEKA
jgi:hypothetical protein